MVRRVIFRILFGKEGETVMAMLWCQQILLGKKVFADVPRLLKNDVRDLLIDSGKPELVTEE